MKERPIIFDGDSVRAILGGRKTQTRRVLKPCRGWDLPPTRAVWTPQVAGMGDCEHHGFWHADYPESAEGCLTLCPFGIPGDRLWVRETYRQSTDPNGKGCVVYRSDASTRLMLCANGGEGDPIRIGGETVSAFDGAWRSPIYMPRWASRITLDVKRVRVERVQDISDEDAQSEGCLQRFAFSNRWDSLNAKRGFGWGTNPWVWVIDFEVHNAEAGAVCRSRNVTDKSITDMPIVNERGNVEERVEQAYRRGVYQGFFYAIDAIKEGVPMPEVENHLYSKLHDWRYKLSLKRWSEPPRPRGIGRKGRAQE